MRGDTDWVYVPAFFLCCTVCQQPWHRFSAPNLCREQTFPPLSLSCFPRVAFLFSHCSSLTSLFYPSFMFLFSEIPSVAPLSLPFFFFFCSIYLYKLAEYSNAVYWKMHQDTSFLQEIKTQGLILSRIKASLFLSLQTCWPVHMLKVLSKSASVFIMI